MVHQETEAAGTEAEVEQTAPEIQDGQHEQGDDTSELYADDLPDNGVEDGGEDGAEGQAEQISAPFALKAEEKDQFARLPVEAQRMLSEVLSRRDRETQQGLEGARSAQRDAQRAAADQVAAAQQHHAQQLNQLVQAFAPQPPPIELVNEDPYEYTRLKAIYDEQAGQFRNLVGQITSIQTEAQNHFANRNQEWFQDQIGQLRSIPEYANDATREQFLSDVKAVGLEMGYPEDQLHQVDARDMFALNKVRIWKADAEKWRAHQKKRNERPRAVGGRFASAPAGSGAAHNGAQSSAASTLKALYPND